MSESLRGLLISNSFDFYFTCYYMVHSSISHNFETNFNMKILRGSWRSVAAGMVVVEILVVDANWRVA